MNRTATTVLLVVVALLAAVIAYNYLTEPRPLEERLDSAAEQLGQGNIGNAIDEVENKTPMEQISEGVNDAVENVSDDLNTSPTQP